MYKARLVVKGYSQKPNFHCKKTFSSIAMLKSIKILISITTHFNYEIWKMNVKIAFLNDDL